MYTKTNICGDIYWYLDPERTILHREDGPAVEYASGIKLWYINGKLHREDGPAVILFNGKKEYYFNDEDYPEIETDEDWIKFLKLKNFW